jgi:hypothetical protein
MIFFDEPPGLDDNGHKAVEGASLIDGNSNKPTSGGLLRGTGWRGCSSTKVPAKHTCSRSICLGCTITPEGCSKPSVLSLGWAL